IGEVREVHAWTGRPIWPQEMTRIPPLKTNPATLDWDLWLGVAAARPFTVGDEDYQSFVAAFLSSRRRHTRLVSDWSSDVCSSDLTVKTWRGYSITLTPICRVFSPA